MVSRLGRFSPKINNAKKLDLQPPLDRIIASDIVQLRTSQYYFDEPLFDAYERTTVPATWDFEAVETIVHDEHRIFDMGCGDGRLLLHLAKKFRLGSSIGIDISDIAIKRFQSRIPAEKKAFIHARQGDIFNIPSDILSQRFNIITFGDATINFILEEDKLEELFCSARKLLFNQDSRVTVAIFDDGTPEQLAFMDKRCTVVPFLPPNGRASLIWWAYKYDAEKLIMHRSVFAQDDWNASGNIEGVVCDLRDRMWTPSSIIPIAKRAGLSVDTIIKSAVQDGVAVGMGTATVILKPV
ncbi:class I SAM-dependent methyltransferase [Bartonella doshiae]|uniref:Methylase of polypeptide chain release factors n=2 Tax=Bartonella doshiae TaxID=33044 RepID=A0A380ZEC7_BARDO|nr:class I SAM-dependent methyltransferase [Bartonella doshiae]EJF81171.1 hypothetical protein MCS_00884 [Bartonella doshiae NCTC 12862 = ATCC 700133]MBB6159953.1 SAM-dependent methyltransferase [Bartonella doshiae]SUV45323.1 Methylase of polypeptide chain release factors [Bartonella doshiae]